MRALAVLALLALIGGCDGIGRPIVGIVPGSDGGGPRTCEVGPSCRPLRTLDEGRFDVPRVPPELPALDCDGDLVDDFVDNCPGVPNPTQAQRACDAARAACERLVRGDTDLADADLRGCRPEVPIELTGGLNLRGASLRCSEITFSGTPGSSVDLTEADVDTSIIRIAEASIDVSRSTLRRSSIVTSGATRIVAHGSIFDDVGFFVSPTGEVVPGPPAPLLDATRSNFARVTFYEPPSIRPGRIRIDRSSLSSSVFSVQLLGLYGTSVVASHLAAVELDAQEVEFTSCTIRTSRGAFASATLTDVIFDRCIELRISNSEVEDVDIPSCPPEGFRAFRSDFLGCNVQGGLELIESYYAAGVLGGDTAGTLIARDSVIDGVRFCDLAGAAFFDGELRCVRCGYDAFMEGRSVCISGSTIFQRGCPAIELAAECG